MLASLLLATALGSASLSWDPPTQNTDGTPLTDLAGYKMYLLTESGGSPAVVRDLNDPAQTTYDWEDLEDGTYCFVATAVNEQGVESDFSNEACKEVVTPPTVPAPPLNLTVISDAVAFEVSEGTDSLALLPIGTVPEGTTCLTNWPSIGGLYVVPRETVELASEFIQRPQVIYAACST